MLEQILNAIDTLGYIADTPGAYARGALSGRLGERRSGREMLTDWGVTSANDESRWELSDVLGALAEMVVDPTNLVGGAMLPKALGKSRALKEIAKSTDIGFTPQQAAALTGRKVTAEEAATAAGKEWVDSLGPEEIRAYHAWKGPGYDAMNKMARRQQMHPKKDIFTDTYVRNLSDKEANQYLKEAVSAIKAAAKDPEADDWTREMAQKLLKQAPKKVSASLAKQDDDMMNWVRNAMRFNAEKTPVTFSPRPTDGGFVEKFDFPDWGQSLEQTIRNSKNLDQALRRDKMANTAMVYRRTNATPGLTDADVGDVFTEPGFLATSKRANADESLYGRALPADMKDKPSLLDIILPKGTPAGDFVKDGGLTVSESEVLLPRNTSMRVVAKKEIPLQTVTTKYGDGGNQYVYGYQKGPDGFPDTPPGRDVDGFASLFKKLQKNNPEASSESLIEMLGRPRPNGLPSYSLGEDTITNQLLEVLDPNESVLARTLRQPQDLSTVLSLLAANNLIQGATGN